MEEETILLNANDGFDELVESLYNGINEEYFKDKEFVDFRRKSSLVGAYQTKERIQIDTAKGLLVAEPGDYIVKDSRGKYHTCSKEDFFEDYEVL